MFEGSARPTSTSEASETTSSPSPCRISARWAPLSTSTCLEDGIQATSVSVGTPSGDQFSASVHFPVSGPTQVLVHSAASAEPGRASSPMSVQTPASARRSAVVLPITHRPLPQSRSGPRGTSTGMLNWLLSIHIGFSANPHVRASSYGRMVRTRRRRCRRSPRPRARTRRRRPSSPRRRPSRARAPRPSASSGR